MERHQEDTALKHLLGVATRRLELGGPEGRCPRADVLAGFIDGVLEADEEQLVREHVEGCPRCRDVAQAVSADPVPDEGLRPASRFPRRAWLVAASLAVVAGLSVAGVLSWRSSVPGSPAAPGTPPPREGPMAVLLARLQQDRPEVFRDIVADPRPDLRALLEVRRDPDGRPKRSPCLRVLEARPTFRWQPRGMRPPFTFSLWNDRMELLWQQETSEPSLKIPDDGSVVFAPDLRYMWTVHSKDRPEPGVSSLFAVAGTPARSRFEEGVRGIKSLAPGGPRVYLHASFAVQLGLFEEARHTVTTALRTEASPIRAALMELLVLIEEALQFPSPELLAGAPFEARS